MKKLIPFILLFLAANIQAQPDTCHPTFAEIFDFNVGDVFQYSESFSNPDPFYGSNTSSIEKYTILSKYESVSKDTFIYNTNVIGQSTYNSHKSPPYKKGEIINYYLTNYLYLDSCNGSVVEIFDNIFLLVKIDSLTKYYRYPLLESKFRTEYTYKKGLGLTKYYHYPFEITETKNLMGYIINGNTAGIVWPDAKFANKNEYIPDIILYPNPAHENFTIELPMEYEACQIELISADGSVVLSNRFLNSGQNVISTDNLAPGFYVVRIGAGKDVTFKKIVIY